MMRKRKIPVGKVWVLGIALGVFAGGWTAVLGQVDGVKLSLSSTEYGHNKTHAGAIGVATTAAGAPATGSATVTVIHGPVKLVNAANAGGVPTLTGMTDTEGKLRVDLKADALPEGTGSAVFVLEATAGGASERVTGKITQRQLKSSFFSDRVASELFLGTTVTHDFDEKGDSQGFKRSDPLGRLSIDTLWGVKVPWDLHTSISLSFFSFPTAAKEVTTDTMSMGGMGGTGTTTDDMKKDQKFVDFADAFAGELGVRWVPEKLNFHDSESSRNTDKPTDVFQFGPFARVGILTRETKDLNGDSAIFNWRIGGSFTHHQTKATDKERDRYNEFPIRFVEVSYAHFEEYAGNSSEGRLIIDAGLRLDDLTRGPSFYGGIHVNAGEGEDDIRLFIGLLFGMDKLETLF